MQALAEVMSLSTACSAGKKAAATAAGMAKKSKHTSAVATLAMVAIKRHVRLTKALLSQCAACHALLAVAMHRCHIPEVIAAQRPTTAKKANSGHPLLRQIMAWCSAKHTDNMGPACAAKKISVSWRASFSGKG